VLLADDRTVVGREAQLRGRAQPDRLAACAKRQLGQSFYDQRNGGEFAFCRAEFRLRGFLAFICRGLFPTR
jgi:hypothetical protein